MHRRSKIVITRNRVVLARVKMWSESSVVWAAIGGGQSKSYLSQNTRTEDFWFMRARPGESLCDLRSLHMVQVAKNAPTFRLLDA